MHRNTWLCALVIGLAATAASFANDDRLRPYSYRDFDRDIVHFVKQYRAAAEPPLRRQAVVNLCQTYFLLSVHPHFAQAEQIRGMRSRVRHHLRDFQKSLERERRAAADTGGSGDSTAARGEAVERGEDFWATEDSAPWRENLGLLAQYVGGPVYWHSAAGNFGGSAEAEDLVRLIQATIAPQHWDVNGGPGHIHFYAPQSLLVIRAGMDQHAEVGDLLQQFRDQQ